MWHILTNEIKQKGDWVSRMIETHTLLSSNIISESSSFSLSFGSIIRNHLLNLVKSALSWI